MNPSNHIYKSATGQPDTAPVDLKMEWLEHLAKATCPSSGLAQTTVPVREPIIGDWFREGDLGFIFGARGLGKTWLALHIARRCTEGGIVGDWEVHQPAACYTLTAKCPWTESVNGTRLCPPRQRTGCFIFSTKRCFISPARF